MLLERHNIKSAPASSISWDPTYIAINFAAATTVEAGSDCTIARKGAWSLFQAFCEVFPDVSNFLNYVQL